MVNTTSNFFGFKQSSNYPAELLSIIIKTLKQNNSHMNTEENQQLGEGFKSVTRPWALVLVKEPSVFENTLKNRIVSIHTTGATTLDNMPPEERLWLDAIRVCCVENIHQLRAVVCSLHMKETNEKAHHVVQWIQKEKDGQPPNLIVVVDLLDYLMNQQEKLNDPLRCLYIDNGELSRILSTLVEVCVYETDVGSQLWEKDLGCKMNHFTELMITDKDCLPPLSQITADISPFVRDGIQKLHRILNYYMDNLFI